MRELAILSFQSLDGVMQSPKLPDEDPSGGFTRGGWADPYWEAVMASVAVEAMAEPYDVLFGRKTYDLFAAHRGTKDSPMSDAKKYVVTSSSSGLTWQNSVPVTGEVPSEIAKLKAQDSPLIQIHGSWKLIQTLLVHELIDEFRLRTFPVFVGPGKRLFGESDNLTRLKLVKSDVTENGVIMSIYRRAGRPHDPEN